MTATVTDVYGWTTITDANDFLADLYGPAGDRWDSVANGDDDRRALLMTAYRDMLDHPSYNIPDYATTAWNALSDDNQRRIIQAQTLHAIDVLIAQGSLSLADDGVESYSIGKFSKKFRADANRSFSEENRGIKLSQRVKDKLEPLLIDTPISGKIRRNYYAE